MFGALPAGVGQQADQYKRRNGSPLAAMGINVMSQPQSSPLAVMGINAMSTTDPAEAAALGAKAASGEKPTQEDSKGYMKWVLIGGAVVAAWYFIAE